MDISTTGTAGHRPLTAEAQQAQATVSKLTDIDTLVRTAEQPLLATISRTIDLNAHTLRLILEQLPPEAKIYDQLSLLSEQLSKVKQAPANNAVLARLVFELKGERSAAWALLPLTLKKGLNLAISLKNGELVFTHPSSSPLARSKLTGQSAQSTQFNSLKQPPLRASPGNPPEVINHASSTFVTEKNIRGQDLTGIKPQSLNQVQATLANALRAYVPQASAKLEHIQTLLKSTQGSDTLLRLAQQNHQALLRKLSNTLNQATILKKSIVSIEAIQPQAVKAELFRSGLFLESSLRARLEGSSSISRGDAQINHPAAHDIKAFLLQALSITNLLTTHYGARDGRPNSALVDGLVQIFISTFSHNNSNRSDSKNERLKKLELIERKLSGQIASITEKQLNTVSASTREPTHLNAQAELLFRLSDHPIPVTLFIERKSAKGETNKKQKNRDWRFSLEWDFPGSGMFNAEIRLANESLSYKLWVQSPTLRSKMKKEINNLIKQLEQKELKVERFQFVDNAFICKRSSNSRPDQLIDVRT